MSECLSREDLRRYASGAMAPEELLRTDSHVASCTSCRIQLLDPHGLSQAVRSLADKVRWNPRVEFNCLNDEQAAAYVAGTLNTTDREIAESHMELCQTCVDDVRSLREFHTAMSTYPETVYAPETRPSSLPGWAARFQSLIVPQWAYAAAAVAVLIAIALFVYQLTVTSRLREQVRVLQNQVANPPAQQQPAPQSVGSTNQENRNSEEQQDARKSEPQSAEDLAENRPRPRESAAPRRSASANTIVAATSSASAGESLVTIKDVGGTVGLRLELPQGVSVPRELGQATVELLRTGAATPTESVQLALAQLASEGETVRSGDEEPPVPLSPVRTLVLSTRPTLRWTDVKGASGYVVSLFTAEPRQRLWEREVARMDHLEFPANQAALRPGETYVWTVAAQIAGQPAYSNLAKFRVLGDARRVEVQRLSRRYAGLQTVLAAVYEREGLYDEAAAALEELARRNPSSESVKRLRTTLQQRHRDAPVKQP